MNKILDQISTLYGGLGYMLAAIYVYVLYIVIIIEYTG